MVYHYRSKLNRYFTMLSIKQPGALKILSNQIMEDTTIFLLEQEYSQFNIEMSLY